jgi:hypothetical protein
MYRLSMSPDAAIRSNVFCSFLALAMQKYLEVLAHDAGGAPQWRELLRDLDRLPQMRLQHRGDDWLVARTDEANDQCHLACLDRHRSVRADREADIGLHNSGPSLAPCPTMSNRE